MIYKQYMIYKEIYLARTLQNNRDGPKPVLPPIELLPLNRLKPAYGELPMAPPLLPVPPPELAQLEGPA